MTAILNRMHWEANLLNRNNLLAVSVVVTGIYAALLQLVKALGYTELLTILMVLNDPAVIGTLFAGITIIYERDQHTLDAMRVTPVNPHHYLLGKIIVLTILGTICGWVMAIAALGMGIDHFHFLSTLFLVTLFFTNLGVAMSLRSKRFIEFALKVALVLVLMILPIFDWFGVFDLPLIEAFPMEYAIRLFAFSMHFQVADLPWIGYIIMTVLSIASYFWAYRLFITTKE